jgi:hypothetical protein
MNQLGQDKQYSGANMCVETIPTIAIAMSLLQTDMPAFGSHSHYHSSNNRNRVDIWLPPRVTMTNIKLEPSALKLNL